MRKRLLVIILIIVFCIMLSGCTHRAESIKLSVSSTSELIKSDVSELVPDKKPQRIIVLSLATATILEGLGIDIVGLVNTKRQLSDGLNKLPKVGTPIKPNIEKILELKADLVITSSNFYNVQRDMFSKNNINALYVDNISYADTKKSIEYFGRYFDKEKEAEELLTQFNLIESRQSAKINGRSKPRVLILHSNTKEIQMATSQSYSGSLIKELGAYNIADNFDADKKRTYVNISLEQIAKENPEIILTIVHSKNKSIKENIKNEFQENSLWRVTDAVRKNRIYELDEELFYANPGIKCTDALQYLTDILYP